MIRLVFAGEANQFTYPTLAYSVVHFFRRSRKVQYEKSPFEIVPNTLSSHNTYVTTDVVNKENGHLFVLKLEAVKVIINDKHIFHINLIVLVLYFKGKYIPL